MGLDLDKLLSGAQQYVSAADAALTDYTGKDTAPSSSSSSSSDKTPIYVAGALLLALGIGLWAARR